MQTMQHMTTPSRPAHAMRRADYSKWSIEELWQLASQLRVTGARSKSRRELIDFFVVPPQSAQR